jgi:hypothetical protein
VNAGGVGARFGAAGVIIGYQGCSGCDGNVMLGVDYDARLVARTLTGNGASTFFTTGLRPSVGFARTLGSGPGATLISAALDVPFAVSVPVGRTAKVVPFMAPGYGLGAVRASGDHTSGTRGSIAFGAGVVDLAPGLAVNLSWRKIFIEGGPMTIGLGLTLGH